MTKRIFLFALMVLSLGLGVGAQSRIQNGATSVQANSDGSVTVTLASGKAFKLACQSALPVSPTLGGFFCKSGASAGVYVSDGATWYRIGDITGALGYTPENSANKENTTIDTSTTKYPTVNLLKNGLDAKQPVNSNLTAIAGLTPTDDDVLQRKANTWVNRTLAQLKLDLAISNVDNTSDAAKPVSTAQQTALDLKVPTSTTVNGHPLSGNVSVTAADVGLGNVTNTSDANKPVSTAQQTALNLKAPLASPAFTGTPSASSLALTGTGGAGYVEFASQSSNPSAPASGFREFADSSGRRSWIRASDGFVRTWDATLTANRVYTLPDADSKFPIFSQTITFAGPTAARTFTLPDATTTLCGTNAVCSGYGATASGLNQFASTTSAQLAGVLSDETGTGALVFGTSPAFTAGITIGAGSAITSSGAGGALGSNAFNSTAIPTANSTTGALPYLSASNVYSDSPLFKTGASIVGVGGTTASFPAIRNNGTTLEIKLADDSTYTTLRADNLRAQTNVFGFTVFASDNGSRQRAALNNNGEVATIAGGNFNWVADANSVTGSRDTGLARSAAGVVSATAGSGSTGGALQATGTSQPTCSSTTRGAMWTVQSAAGVGDIFQVCMKGTADTYAWRTVFTAP